MKVHCAIITKDLISVYLFVWMLAFGAGQMENENITHQKVLFTRNTFECFLLFIRPNIQVLWALFLSPSICELEN